MTSLPAIEHWTILGEKNAASSKTSATSITKTWLSGAVINLFAPAAKNDQEQRMKTPASMTIR
ncbi:hypothetical protein DLM45_12110 [Hyphomicrobium methylovorum]|nr:hypothetical protein [Hyphomicrobium methylovorum]